MQTKSPLVRVAIVAGVPLAILALFLSLKIQRPAHSSQSTASNRTAASAQPATPLSSARKEDLTRAYGVLPLAFEANQGQTAPDVRYLAHGQGYQLFLTDQEAVLTMRQPSAAGTKSAKGGSQSAVRAHRKLNSVAKNSVLRIHFDGANPAAEIAGAKLLPGKTNYFIGNDPQKWHTGIPSYEAVHYQGIYPGVDMLFYGHEQHLEYDFIVAPGADPKAIALSVAGARKLELNSRGDVVMSVAGGKVALQKPVVYQEVNGERRQIAGNYTLANDRQIRFSVAEYDHSQPLTIDPVLNYSTYIGGELFDQSFGIALDAAGDAYIGGFTASANFPQMNPVSGAPGDVLLGTAFVSELNPTGTALLYSSYLGGSGNGSFGDGVEAIAVDTASPPNIYVTGYTGSPDFPTSTVLAPYQGPVPPAPNPVPTSTADEGSAFLTKLAPSASGLAQLAYSSYLGGNIYDEGFGIAVDGSGNAYIAGATGSSTFPTQGTPITTGLQSTNTNAFLTKINTTLSGTASLVYSTYLGGSGTGSNFLNFGDVANAVTIDSSSNAYLVGGTTSLNFPTAGTAIAGSAACGVNTMSSTFISVINTTAQSLTYSHCLSGNTYDEAFGVSLGTGVPAVATGIVYLTGTTASSNLPVTANTIPLPACNNLPPTQACVAQGVAFVALLNTANGTLQYLTYLGGNSSDTGYAISSDSSGNAYVTGQTSSTDFPITQGALEVTRANPTGAGFVSKISPNGNGLADLVYSTFFGGQTPNTLLSQDNGRGIAVSGTNAYITGQMASPDMPVSSGAFQTALGAAGATNAYVADLPLTPTISVSPTSIAFGIQLVAAPSQPQYVTITNNTSNSIGLTLPPTSTNPDFVGTASGTTPCTTPLAGGASCTIGVIFTPAIAGAVSATLDVVDALDGPNHPMVVALSGTGSGTASNITLTPNVLTFPGTLLTQTSMPMMVSIGNSGNLPLSVSAISAGTGVFAETASTAACNNGNFPIVIAPAGPPCAVSVTFSPVAATPTGPVTGALTITQTGGNVSTVPLSGTAWDFSVTAASSVTVAKGMSGPFAVTVTGLGGFTGAVAFTCTPGSALITSCMVPNINAAPAPGTTANGTLTAASFAVPPQSMKVPPSALLRQVIFIMLAMALLFMIPSVRRFRTRMGMTGAMLVFVLVAGCSGGPAAPKTSSAMITPSSGGVTKPAITVNVTITQ
jgi:Beta-propeller repeat